LEFLELFHDSTVVLSGVYYPTSPLILHHVLEIASHLHASEREHNLRNIVYPMMLKFLKYWQDIPLLYSYAFILGPRAKMRGFFNVLQLLGECTGTDYMSYYADVKTELYKLFNKYEWKFGAARSQRAPQPEVIQVKKSRHGAKSLEAMVQVLLALLLPLSLLPLHLVLFVSCQLT